MRNVKGLAISGSGVFTPEQSISNAELIGAFNTYVQKANAKNALAIAAGKAEALLESSAEFVVKASGIHNRYVMDKTGILDPDIMCPRIPERPNEELSILAEMALVAAREAMERAGRGPADIDGVIVSCSNMQRPYPAMAIEVQNALGISGFAFDMNVGCSSAAFAMQVAADSVASGSARAVLVCSPEINTGHLNFHDRDSHFIFGDAASAFVVERVEDAHGRNAWEIVSTKLTTRFSNNIRNNFGFLNRAAPEGIGARDKLFVQEGRKVFREVVAMVAELILDHLKQNGLEAAALKRLWLHQANKTMDMLIAHRVLGRDPEPGEMPIILDEYANTSSAGAMIAFHKYSEDLKPGDLGLPARSGPAIPSAVSSYAKRRADARLLARKKYGIVHFTHV